MSYILGTVPQWISKSFPVLQSICLVILALLALALIVLVFMQITGDGDNGNVITGNQDSYYAQNKGDTKEGRLKKIIIICSVIILVLTVAFYVIEHFFAG